MLQQAAILALACTFAAAQTPSSSDHYALPVTPMDEPRPVDVSGDIFYHIMPIAWRHAPAAGAAADSVQNQYRFGTFRGIVEGIPYLKSLGVTGIWLNPIFPSPAYHGYQHDAADSINPWFGDEREFKAMVDACHAQGIKVYLDLVAYGISQKSVYFRNSVNSAASGYAAMLAYTDAGNTKYTGYTFKTWNGDEVGFINWDLRRTTARRLVFEWSKMWLRADVAGIDGYRLDHVWKTYENGADGLGYHIDTFWKEWRAEVESVKPDVFTFVEQQDWTSFGAELLRSSDGTRVHDAAFTKPFEFAAREALREQDATKLYLSMAATRTACPDGFTFLGIIGDHDVDRLASDIGADQQPGRAQAAAAVLMLQPFPPVIYYGDELGMLGRAGSYNSDANDIPRREPMKWNAVASESKVMSNYYALHEKAYAARMSQDNDGKSVEEQEKDPKSLLQHYRALAAVRKQFAAIRKGAYVPLSTDAKSVWCFAMNLDKGEDVVVAINLGDKAVECAVSPPGPQVSLRGVPDSIAIEPFGWKVIPLRADSKPGSK
jgi:glycosidase